jgi:hypothetical protein
MSWQIHIPFRDPTDTLAEVGEAVRELPDPEDRAVARELTLEAACSGISTAGGLIDELDQLDRAQRRGLLDRIRARVGLPTASRVDAAPRDAAASANMPTRLVITESGAIVDAADREREAARERERQRTRDAENLAREIEHRAEVERRRRMVELSASGSRTSCRPGFPEHPGERRADRDPAKGRRA